ncbi:hypothetical protein B9Z65_6986 [Elsinoe australis]|uniref:Transaldolase n=1 Tax=Elsinoe australis TaxID=40998 RepID=A0A2P7Z487_9PEZI|nr:hypothetical protein B9Z65_6986 [Elsinoe australis]
MTSLLDDVRSRIQLDCDTLDTSVAPALGPFVDCTSNQAIAASELADPKHEDLIRKSVQQAREAHPTFQDVSLAQLAVDIMTINLQARTLPHLSGRVHIQTDPYSSYSTPKTISNAERIVKLSKLLHPTLDTSRICIKIPSTWEGLSACHQLESAGIRTLATTLFNMEQAALAAASKCTYIAPYVNDLKVHFIAGFKDQDPGFALTHAAKLYYQRVSAETQVMPASLTSVAEVQALIGKADHITVAPHLLRQMAEMPASAALKQDEAVPAEVEALSKADYTLICKDEAAFRMAMTRSKDGNNEKKLVDAINIFCEAQDRLLALAERYLKP